MPRVVSLFLPTWSTDRLRRTLGDAAPPPDTPLVLIGREGRRRVVLAADAAARRAGLRVGMSVTKAQALVFGTCWYGMPILPRMPLHWNGSPLWALQRYAPIAAADPPDGLIIDVSGATHLHGGEHVMLAEMIERLGAAGFNAHAAIADHWGAAHALARYAGKAGRYRSTQCESIAAIMPLPIVALRLSPELIDDLRRLGFEHVNDLLTKPRAPLALRFGPELGRRLDQATGRFNEPIDPIRPAELVEVRRAFAEPIGAPETIARYTAKLVIHLCEALEAKGLGARRLDLLFYRVDNRLEAIRVGTALPVRDVKRLTRLLCDKIETVDPDFGIEIMSLTATLAEPLTPKQVSSSLTGAPEA